MIGLRLLLGYNVLTIRNEEMLINWLQVFFVLFGSFAITGVYHGTGQHTSVLPEAEIPMGLKVSAQLQYL